MPRLNYLAIPPYFKPNENLRLIQYLCSWCRYTKMSPVSHLQEYLVSRYVNYDQINVFKYQTLVSDFMFWMTAGSEDETETGVPHLEQFVSNSSEETV